LRIQLSRAALEGAVKVRKRVRVLTSAEAPLDRQYVFYHRTRLENYTAQAVAVICFDDRFQEAFAKYRMSLGIDHLDQVSVAGGAKTLASPEKEGDRDFLLREIQISEQLHQARKVMLFTHHDCGAYGGIARFGGDEEEELAFHVVQHKQAKEAVHTRLPEVPVESYFIDKHGIVKTLS